MAFETVNLAIGATTSKEELCGGVLDVTFQKMTSPGMNLKKAALEMIKGGNRVSTPAADVHK